MQDVATISNIKTLEEGIELYKTGKHLESKTGEESYPLVKNEDGTYVTLAQMKTSEELAKIPDEVKYILLNMSSTKGTTEIQTLDKLDYTKFYKLDASSLNITEKEAEDLVIYIEGDNYKVINLAGVKYQNQKINVIIPLNNEADPEYITVANNTYKLYGNGTLKALGEKTVNSGYSSSEVNAINYSLDEFNLEQINADFGNQMSLPAKKIYFSTGTAYVIDTNDDLWAWGANDSNKLGLGHSYLITEPTKILEGRCENTKVSKVWAGATNTFVVDLNGKVWGCGTNSFGELGIGQGVSTDRYVEITMPSGLTGNDIEYMSLSETFQMGCTTIIKYNNGKVYAMGDNTLGQLGTGNRSRIYTLTEMPQFNNCNYIETSGYATVMIDYENNLYICGSFYINGNGQRILTPQKVKENVKQASCDVRLQGRLNGISLDGECFTFNQSLTNETIIDNIPKDANTIMLNKEYFLVGNEIYNLSGKKVFTNMSNAEKYYDGMYANGENKNILVLKNNNKLYVNATPDITKVKEKSNYELRKIFENAIFVQGKGGNISIVDREGKVYESPTSEFTTSNVKKIISSALQKYIITNDNHLYAKGELAGSIWGEYANKYNYVEIKKENGEILGNVKNIFTSSWGNSVIIQTEDNKIYWGRKCRIYNFTTE